MMLEKVKNVSYAKLLCFLVFFSFYDEAFAAGESAFSLGALGIYSNSIYQDVDAEAQLLPYAAFDNGRFFVKGLIVGYHFSPYLDAAIKYPDTYFDPDDSSDKNIQRLNERESGALAKIDLKLGMVKFGLIQDLSGDFDEYSLSSTVTLPLYKGAFFVTGAVSYVYNSRALSENKYSVSDTESLRTGGTINAYDSARVNELRYTLSFIQPFSQRLTLITNLSHTNYDDVVVKSPIVEKDKKTGITAILSYRF
ncbi:MipA/OmpV family protein [Marinomonas algarum]|uniref:MipA/OmpV family protein n=1 Tax=Marinomonas algarum TaxID=2883105 RepID=A0A9X1LES2_9GAMM|nr:MipA/OmpV family protein [Marinomonas algarum]MCB5161695.1 MipA/OmpV family protein [Marinomonas algarum]